MGLLNDIGNILANAAAQPSKESDIWLKVGDALERLAVAAFRDSRLCAPCVAALREARRTVRPDDRVPDEIQDKCDLCPF